MGEMGIAKDSVAGRKEFERRMEARRWEISRSNGRVCGKAGVWVMALFARSCWPKWRSGREHRTMAKSFENAHPLVQAGFARPQPDCLLERGIQHMKYAWMPRR